MDPGALVAARDFVVETFSRELRSELKAIYASERPTGAYSADRASIDGRRVANAALGLLNAVDDAEAQELAKAQFAAADNMTDSQSALACLVQNEGPAREESLATFYGKWKDDALVLDKWFAIQATSRCFGADTANVLRGHGDFSLANPNRVRSLVGAFAMQNFRGFHAKDGSGYRFLSDIVIELDPSNPQVASRMVRALNPWKQFAAPWGDLMKGELERIAARGKELSKDVFEIVSSALAD